jgi:phage terminase Nu1 subunit (DNA packaging protein)
MNALKRSRKTPAKKAASAPRTPPKRAVPAKTMGPVSREERWHMIAEAAYYRAKQRDFAAGDAVADWLAAEAEVDRILGEQGRQPGG